MKRYVLDGTGRITCARLHVARDNARTFRPRDENGRCVEISSLVLISLYLILRAHFISQTRIKLREENFALLKLALKTIFTLRNKSSDHPSTHPCLTDYSRIIGAYLKDFTF